MDNRTAPPLRVRHSELTRATAESAFRSVCPTCRVGTLLVGRDTLTFRVRRDDYCLLCGQRVLYEDETIAGEPVAELEAKS